MEQNQAVTKAVSFKELIKRDEVKDRFQEMLGENSTSFLLSVLNCVQGNAKLLQCEPQSVLMASAVAGTLSLPVDPSLGMAYIIPYGKKAQFQIGYRGLIDLCHRSQQFAKLNVTDVRESELLKTDRLSGVLEFDWLQDQDERKKEKIIGYVGYFQLVNGFSKTFYMTVTEIDAHAKKFSKTYNFSGGIWKTDLHSMSMKTVLKLLLDKFAPKSVEMRKALKTDQAIINDWDGEIIDYEDNPMSEVKTIDSIKEEQEMQRVIEHINDAETLEILEEVYEFLPDDFTRKLYDGKKEELNKKG